MKYKCLCTAEIFCRQLMLSSVCSEVLVEKCRAELFRPWIHKFGREIIVHSVKYVPIHSSRIVSITVTVTL